MISVCLATYNGGQYLREQILSILNQLSPDDELIISDDRSSDNTLQLIDSIGDPRIKVFSNPKSGIVTNFENALRYANGQIVFLSDQDDVWLKGRIEFAVNALKEVDLIVINAYIYYEHTARLGGVLYDSIRMRRGFFNNLYRNSYVGCCMAFKKEFFDIFLPFPPKIPMHDWWIGLLAEVMGLKVGFVERPFLLYRRHGNNASATSGKSSFSLITKVYHRFLISFLIFNRVFNFHLRRVFRR
jgi:glycosyltransferase involved in cell wall biosynthesis